MKKDISNIGDIKFLVDTFYGHVRKDELIDPIFNEKIEDNWPAHLEKMYRFWQTVLLEEHTYYGSPFMPHSQLPIDKSHFERWIQLFEKTISENFEGKVADDALLRAASMAQMFQYKIEYYQGKHPLK
jgi:hemoglobin